MASHSKKTINMLVLCCLVMFFSNGNCDDDYQVQMKSCKDRNMEKCLTGDTLTITELLYEMVAHPGNIRYQCKLRLPPFESCLGDCRAAFKDTNDGFRYKLCLLAELIEKETRCLTSSFPKEARKCHSSYYPFETLKDYYPTPVKPYDVDSIAKDCFAEDDDHCKKVKSFLIYSLMPNYYETHPYPPEFKRE